MVEVLFFVLHTTDFTFPVLIRFFLTPRLQKVQTTPLILTSMVLAAAGCCPKRKRATRKNVKRGLTLEYPVCSKLLTGKGCLRAI